MKGAALTVVAVLFLVVGCNSDSYGQYTPQPPEIIDDGLSVGTLDEVGMDSDLLSEAAARIAREDYGEVHSLLVYRNGNLVFEEYFPGHTYKWDGPGFHGAWVDWDENEPHNIHSVGKSITSASVGIAIDRGFIESVNQSIFDYLPDHQRFRIEGKEAITIEHLLTMTSGLAWDEWGTSYSHTENDMIRLWLDCEDQVACVLEAPLDSQPGTEFTYSGGNMVLLGEIIKNATQRDIEEFSAKHIFEPLDIDPPEWGRFDSGMVDASGDQYLTPRDMVKFGSTYLKQGYWRGQQVIPTSWVDKSATTYEGNSWHNSFLRSMPPGDNTWGRRGYSYAWWTHEYSKSGTDFPAYFAVGFGGQKIYVLPEQDAVVVFTAANYDTADTTTEILTDYVIPAMH